MRDFENACVRCAIERASRANSKQVGIDYINEWTNRMKECKPDVKTILNHYENIYDYYTSNDKLRPSSNQIREKEEKLNYFRVELNIIDYLKENGVDINKISNDEIEEMAGDVIDYSAETEQNIDDLIWIEDYFDGKVEGLLRNEEKIEEDEI